MSAEPGRSPSSISLESPAVAVVAALGIERRCLARGLRGGGRWTVTVRQCGPGAVRARQTAETAAAEGAAGLISWGLAGGLAAGTEPGTVVLPSRVLQAGAGTAFGVDAAWRDRLAAELGPRLRLHEGPLLAVDEVLHDPADKARAASKSGAAAADMESAGVAAAAAAAGLPFVVLRVVADGPEDALPAGVERWIDERGNRRLAPLADVATRPVEWRALLALALRYGTARRTLDALARCLVPRGFLFEHRPFGGA
jgi:adenosylhomocysteine nucleosidase